MTKIDAYRKELTVMDDWEPYLLKESGLPGPRANLELARAVAEEGDEALFRRYLTFDAVKAPSNSPHEFLTFCGVHGLGRLLSEGRKDMLEILRSYASDPRWRMREAVALALQRFGKENLNVLLLEMRRWSKGNLLERRASIAALCEPKLLNSESQIKKVFEILNSVTASILNVKDRKSDKFKVLRKGLAYCWSVAVAALPDYGKKQMEGWFTSDDKDVQWIMKENLKKKRLERMDAEWIAKWRKT